MGFGRAALYFGDELLVVSTGIHILSRTIFIALLNRDSISLYNTAQNEMSLVLKFLSNRAIT